MVLSVRSVKSEKTGKWGGQINRFKGGHYHRRVYTYSGPGFETEEELWKM